MTEDFLHKKAKELIADWKKTLKQKSKERVFESITPLLKKFAFGKIPQHIAENLAADIASSFFQCPDQNLIDEIKKCVDKHYWYFDANIGPRVTEEEHDAQVKHARGG